MEVLRDSEDKPVMRQLSLKKRSDIEVPVLDSTTGRTGLYGPPEWE
jgi:hypothetical protein